MKKEKTTLIMIFVICLLLAISNVTNVAVAKRQEDRINSFKQEIEEIQNEKEEYKSEVESLTKQLNKLNNEITGIKEQTDKIADKLIEIQTREEAQEELKAVSEDVTEEEITTEYVPTKTIIVEETTTEGVTTEETTEENTTETEQINIEENNAEETSIDIPWVVYEVVECEVHGGDKESKMHVAHVIRNRVWSDLFPDDYYTVCTSPNQFCTRSDVEQSTIDAVNEAMRIDDTTGGALFFHSMEWMSSWGGYEYKFTDNVGHHFY